MAKTEEHHNLPVGFERNVANLKREDMLDDYLDRSIKKDGALVATALRTRSTSMRDILVRGAVDVTSRSEELKSLVLSNQLCDHNVLDSFQLGELGRLVMLQNLLENDISYGEALLVKAHHLSGRRKMPRHLRTVLAQHYIVTGQANKARSFLDAWPDVAAENHGYLAAELDNPYVLGTVENFQAWLDAFNRPFTAKGLLPVEVDGSKSGHPFDRLRTNSKVDEVHNAATETDQAKELVSVVLTAFQPHPTHLETSVRSILEQTWPNLELIIVDDCSGPEYLELFERMEALDPRVRTIYLSENQGTYVARNIGYAASRGDFITGQDDDDWSHPQRVASQIEYMRENSEAIGCRVLGIRCNGNLQKVRVGYGPTTYNSSSLLIRREGYTATGGYLPARKAADTEFLHRVSKATGRPVGSIKQPLSLIRILDGSLSRKEFAPGWMHSARRSFRSAYVYWHENASSKELKLMDGTQPKVYIPHRLKSQTEPLNVEFDVVFAGDWEHYGGPQRSMLEEIFALKRAGLRVGIMNLEATRFMTSNIQKRLVPSIQKLINDGYVEQIHYDDQFKVDLLILRYPPILQFFTYETSGLEVQSLVILANQAPSELDGSDIRYLVEDCDRTAARSFNVKPLWVPQGPQVRDFLEHYVSNLHLAEFNIPGILDLDEWWQERLWFRSEVPVVGRHSRDNKMKWPSSREVMDSVYPVDGRFDVRVMGGASVPLGVLGKSKIPAGWTVYKTDEWPVKNFLWSLDYFVFYQHPNAVEAFGRAVLEALASGAVVILPPSFRRLFGEAAIYCEHVEVQGVIEQLHSDFELYQRQLQRAIEILNEDFSYSSYLKRVESLLADSRG